MIWLAFLSTIAMFVFLLKQMLMNVSPPEGGTEDVTKLFAMAAAAAGFGSVVFRKAFNVGGDHQKWHVRNVVCWVLNETIAIFGFLAANQRFDFNVAVPFFAAAVTLTLLMFPKVPEPGAI